MKGTFRKDIQIASMESEDDWNQFKVHSLLENVNQKQPSINAYLGARYSRSSDSVIDIASEIIKNNTDAAQRLEAIFHGYGHKSVGDMAQLFVCIENIPMFTAMRIFYLNSVISGQERSTRYQNFEEPEYIRIPREICNDNKIRQEYEDIILKQMHDYSVLLKKTKEIFKEYFNINEDIKEEKSALQARSFDCARYLLPYGVQTSMAAVMSARNWSELISYLNASDGIVDREVGKLIYNLLGDSDIEIAGYVREADGLIRHTEANYSRKISTKEILEYLRKKVSPQKVYINQGSESDSCTVSYNDNAVEDLFTHYELLVNPLGSENELEFDDEDSEYIGEVLFKSHNQHSLIGNLGQSGSIKIEGMASLCTLKDLNRHRSFERFIPLLHDEVNIDNELNRDSKDCFFLCNYLDIPEMSQLKKEYEKALIGTYNMIKRWRKDSIKVMPEEYSQEYTRYLLPHAHSTKYCFYASIDDLQYTINLRSEMGGHIAYRVLMYKWLELLNGNDSIWYPLLRKIEMPDPASKDQFIDRS
jgi:thymidylate synthase ThyX